MERLGVTVKGSRLADDSEELCDSGDSEENFEQNIRTDIKQKDDYLSLDESNIDKINLDVSAMIAYVSALTNGHANYEFKVPVLTQQAEWERERPVKPILDELFKSMYINKNCHDALRKKMKKII